jgi:hypothetical protein
MGKGKGDERWTLQLDKVEECADHERGSGVGYDGMD